RMPPGLRVSDWASSSPFQASVSEADFWYLVFGPARLASCADGLRVYRFRRQTWQLAAPTALRLVPQTRSLLMVQRSKCCADGLGRAPMVEPSMLPTFNG